MARPCNCASNASRSCRRVKYTATDRSPMASSNCEITTAAIKRRWMDVVRISAAKHVSLSAKSMNQLALTTVLEFTAQAGDVHLDDVAEAFPVEIIKMLEQLGLGNNGAGAVREIFEDAIFHGREGDGFALAAHAEIGCVDLQI